MSGLLAYFSFIVCFNTTDLRSFVFCKSQNTVLCFLHLYIFLSEKQANCHTVSTASLKIYNVQLILNYYVHTYQILICPFFWYVRTLRSVHKTICIGRFCNNFYPRKSPYSSPSRIFYCIAMFQIIFCLNSNHSV